MTGNSFNDLFDDWLGWSPGWFSMAWSSLRDDVPMCWLCLGFPCAGYAGNIYHLPQNMAHILVNAPYRIRASWIWRLRITWCIMGDNDISVVGHWTTKKFNKSKLIVVRKKESGPSYLILSYPILSYPPCLFYSWCSRFCCVLQQWYLIALGSGLCHRTPLGRAPQLCRDLLAARCAWVITGLGSLIWDSIFWSIVFFSTIFFWIC